MNDVLQSIARLLNTTTDELKSVIDVSKENLPKLYTVLAREHSQYDFFTHLGELMMFLAMMSFLALMMSSFEEEVARQRGTHSASILPSFISLMLCIIASGVFYSIRVAQSPNYSFLLEVLHKR